MIIAAIICLVVLIVASIVSDFVSGLKRKEDIKLIILRNLVAVNAVTLILIIAGVACLI